VGLEDVRLGATPQKPAFAFDHDVVTPVLFAGATAVPEHSILQSDSAILAQSIGITRRWRDALPALYKKSGVERRGSVLLQQESGAPELRQSFYAKASDSHPSGPSTAQRMQAYREFAAPLLTKACERTLAVSGMAARRVTHLVTVSCTGFSAPGIDHELIERLGLCPSVQRTHVGFMGCHGLLNGLRVAGAIANGDRNAMVLVGAVELCSIHQQFSEDPQQLVANALFADGAASFLVAATDNTDLLEPSENAWKLRSSFSYKIPNTHQMMGWEIGDYGFRMSLSPEVPGIVESVLREALVGWLAESDRDLSHINVWAVHPGGPRIIDAVESALSLQPASLSASRSVLRNYGNMSSPTVAFVLNECVRVDSEIETCVVLGFGPGLSVEAMLLTRSLRNIVD
jgi:predicted naringenin-chalcone synthase